MTGASISQFHIVEKLGEVPKSPASVPQRVVVILRTAMFLFAGGKKV